MLYLLALEVIAGTPKYVPRMCWSNAVEALLTSGHEALEGAVYVEGWAIPDGFDLVVEHGWIEFTDGTILDITWLDQDAQYFAGVRYSVDELKTRNPDFLPLIWTTGGWGGMQNLEYRRAYSEALETARRVSV